MRRIIATLSLALLLCGAALAAPAGGEVAERIAARLGARLEQFPVVRADFVQTKEMAAFKKPLVTKGRLVFSRQNGVLWQIEQPLKLTYVLQETRVVEIGEDGAVQIKTAQDVPGIAQVGRIFRGLLGGQTKALGDLFDSAGSGDPERAWTLVLTPRNPQVAQFIRRITLAGGKQVDSIRIEEASGDTATMRFQHTSEAAAISAEEGRLFAR
ncbi:MAG: outer membrane lipoprotein carrier protein LolA [Betaproteobacteria bacterium]